MVNITVKNEDNKEMSIKGDIALIISQTKDEDGYSIVSNLVGSASIKDLMVISKALSTDIKEQLNIMVDAIKVVDLTHDVSEDKFEKAVNSIEDEETKRVILEYVKSKGGQA